MDDINIKVKEIKQSFRQMMDGATAQSMRQKGLDYHVNWGATIPRLREMAGGIKDKERAEANSSLYGLSIALWKENVRECKILATMLMPPEQMLPEVADIWMEQTPTLEIAEQAAFNLYQHLPYAADKAYEWIASPDDLPQICGYHVLSRLFMKGQEPNERGINEFLDQALTALAGADSREDPAADSREGPAADSREGPAADSREGPAYAVALQKAAMQAVIRFAGFSIMHRRLAQSAIRSIGMAFL